MVYPAVSANSGKSEKQRFSVTNTELLAVTAAKMAPSRVDRKALISDWPDFAEAAGFSLPARRQVLGASKALDGLSGSLSKFRQIGKATLFGNEHRTFSSDRCQDGSVSHRPESVDF